MKKAAATANEELKVLDAERAQAIRDAADLVATGKYDAHFPIDVFQTGSGTSSNMNANEVLATWQPVLWSPRALRFTPTTT